MVRDVWEFLNKETKARVIFGGVIVLVLLVIAVPYFVTVLGGGNSKTEINTAVETEEVEESTEEGESDEAVVAEEPAPVENEELEEAEVYPNTSAGATSVAAAAGGRATTPQATTPTTSQATPAANADATPKTTVDDRSAGDNGYTASGIDNPGVNETTAPVGNSDATDNGEV